MPTITADRFPLPADVRVRVPTEGSRAFGAPRGRGSRAHEGVDLFAAPGTPVSSPVTGRVVATLDRGDRNCGFGIVIRDARPPHAQWTMCHFGAVPVLERGEPVRAGDVVGVVGDSGNARGAPHLHIHARVQGATVDATTALVDALDAEAGVPARRADGRRTAESTRGGGALGLALALGALGWMLITRR